MLSVAEADAAIADALRPLPAEHIASDKAAGRVLAEPVVAERDQPPFDRVTMDGVAIRHEPARRSWTIRGRALAGSPAGTLNDAGDCVEIMTGAPLPNGADTVIAVERLDIVDGRAMLAREATVEPGQNVHRRASDHDAGTTLLRPGHRLGVAELAVVFSAGLTAVTVARQPRVRVIATGNELVAAGEPIAAHQVRLSNGPAIEAALRHEGLDDVASVLLRDEPDLLARRIGALLDDSDLLILSGGVSMGKADFVPEVLRSLGVREVFHRVAQRPGKPLWFGTDDAGRLVFGLPGNPVSALVGYRRYALPAIWRLQGLDERPFERAVLAREVRFSPPLTAFLPATCRIENDRAVAETIAFNTSGDFASLAGTDGFVELPADRQVFSAGDAVTLHRW